MTIVLLLLGLFLAFWGFNVVIQGALGVALMVCGAVLMSAAFIGSWIQQSSKKATESTEAIRKLLVEIREQGKAPGAVAPSEVASSRTKNQPLPSH